MIPPPILSLLEPLETFEAIRRKSARLGERLCDLSYANPYQGAQEGALAALRDALEERRLLGLQYSPFGGYTIVRRLVADALRRSHNLPFNHRDVILTPGQLSALQTTLLTAGAPGPVILTHNPSSLASPAFFHTL